MVDATINKTPLKVPTVPTTLSQVIMQYMHSIARAFTTMWSLLVTYVRIMININVRALRYIVAISIIHILLYIIPSQDTTKYSQSVHSTQSDESIDDSDDSNSIDNSANGTVGDTVGGTTDDSTNDDIAVANSTAALSNILDHLRNTVNSDYIYNICNSNSIKSMANRIAFADMYSTMYNDINTVISSDDITYIRILYSILNDIDISRSRRLGWGNHYISVLNDLRNDYMKVIENILG